MTAPEAVARESVERWASLALELDWVSGWREGAIFPCEMVYFLAACDAAGIRAVIESGRQDGYSTMILGEYARRTDVRIVSIDFEDDVDRAARCRAALAPYPIDIRKGNAFEAVVAAVRECREPAALIVDGPKGFLAQSMALASLACGPVRLLSFHNLPEGSDFRASFQGLAAGSSAFYETDVDPLDATSWRRLREREREICDAKGARRSLEASSLGVLRIDESRRGRLARTVALHFGLVQPIVISSLWRRHWDKAAYALYVAAVNAGQR